MSEIRYPEMRAEVLSALESLADREYQERVWIRHILPHPNYQDDFWQAYAWLFENVTVMDAPERAIGVLLRDRAEAHAMLPLREAMTRILDLLGTDRTDAEYIASPLWDDVVAAATVALDTLRRRDDEVGDVVGLADDATVGAETTGVPAHAEPPRPDIPLTDATWTAEATSTVTADREPDEP